MATATQTGTEMLNRLLRGELAAVETYGKGIEKFAEKPEVAELTRIQTEHERTVNLLRQHVVTRGGEPSTSSGAWGVFANAVEAVASFVGPAATLKGLKEGEEHGLKEYKTALEDAELPAECANMIRTQLMPQSQEHIATLDRLLAQQG